jgi:hypothetical protein
MMLLSAVLPRILFGILNFCHWNLFVNYFLVLGIFNETLVSYV